MDSSIKKANYNYFISSLGSLLSKGVTFSAF